MSAQFQSFGEPEEAFDLATLKVLNFKAKCMNELIPAKAYLLSYFRVCSDAHGVFMWRPDINTFKHYTMEEIDILIRAISVKFYTPSSNPKEKAKKEEFNISKWFFFDSSLDYVSDYDPIKPKDILIFSQDSCIFHKVYLSIVQKNMLEQDLCLNMLEIFGVLKIGN